MSRLVVVSNRIAPRIIKAAPAASPWRAWRAKSGWRVVVRLEWREQVTRMSH
ncbi:Uncharacterised protein [Salmonella enterica subsp. enterica]|nr:Uncharacterised protein [Salmonella enterica subsp. enterica]